jgi:hypothetical protein
VTADSLFCFVLATSDFDANGNLLTLNNIGTLDWHYNNTLNQLTKANKTNIIEHYVYKIRNFLFKMDPTFGKGNLFVPRPNSNFMKRTVHYSGTILWNSLPPNLKLIQDIDLFKKKYNDLNE